MKPTASTSSAIIAKSSLRPVTLVMLSGNGNGNDFVF